MVRTLENVLNTLGLEDQILSFQEKEIGVDDILLPSFECFIKDLVKPEGRAIRVMNKWKQLMNDIQEISSIVLPILPSTSGSASSSTQIVPATQIVPITPTQNVATADSAASTAVVTLVKSLLERSFTGRVLLRCSNKRLTSSQQNDLVKIVVEGVVDTDKCARVPSSDFERVANAICTIFVKETSLDYFIPGVVHPVLGRVRPKGKLISHYHTIISKYANASRSSSGPQNDDEPDPVAAELNVSLNFLLTHVDPWDQILNHWALTSSPRLAELKQNKIPIARYLDLYKCLQEALGYKLMIIDFCHLYPAAAEPNWSEFFEKALAALIGLKKPSDQLKADLSEINSCEISEESKYTLILLNLSQLCDVVNVAQKKLPKGQKSVKTIYRPTRAEIQEAFVVHIPTIGELNPFKERRKQKLSEFDLPLQPFVVLVGLDKQEPTGCYLIVEDTMFLMRSPKAAVDACFKSFHALWSHYPAEASNLWLLIQKKVYEIHTEFDVITSNLMALMRFFE